MRAHCARVRHFSFFAFTSSPTLSISLFVSQLGVKTFAFSPSPRILLAFLHLFAPFFTPNRLKSGALQWGEGRKTKNGCDAYAREAERSPHAFTPSSRFSFIPFSTSRGGEHRSLVSSDIPHLSTKNGEVFSVLSTAVGDRWRARSFAPCPSPKVCSTKRKAGCENHYLSLALPRKSFIFAAKPPSRSSRDAAFPPV